MKEVSIKIGGMSCQHCVMRVKKAIDSLEGILSSDVQLGIVKVSFDEQRLAISDIEKAIAGAGYKVLNP